MSIVHLSELMLDGVASGHGREPRALAHLAECDACADRLRLLEGEARQAARAPEMAVGLVRMRLAAAPPAPRFGRWPALALATAIGAAAAAFFMWPEQGTQPRSSVAPFERTKGAAGIHLIDEQGTPAASTLIPGDVVALVVSGPNYARTLVFGVDRDGTVSAVWPVTTGDSAPARPGVPLEPAFRVTPGRLTLFAFFGDETLRADDAHRALEAATRACSSVVAWGPDCLVPARLAGERARATAHYAVSDAH